MMDSTSLVCFFQHQISQYFDFDFIFNYNINLLDYKFKMIYEPNLTYVNTCLGCCQGWQFIDGQAYV